jgi:hypothetical protein
VMFRLKDPALCQQVCSMVLAPYLADTEKARILLSDGTYAKAKWAHKASRSRHGTRFSVQEFLMGLSEGQEGAEEAHGLPHILKGKTSAVFEILSKNWHEEHNA